MTDFAPNVGAAILPSSNRPLAHYMQNKQQQQMNEAMQQRQMAEARKERNKNLNELLEFAPDKYWDPYHEEITNATNKMVVNFATDHLNKGGAWDNIEFQKQLKANQDYVNLLANKSRLGQERFTEVMKEIEGNEYIDQDKARAMLHDMVYSADGKTLNVETLEPRKFSDVLTNPEVININSVARDFVKGLPEHVQEYAKIMNDKLGGSFVEANKITGKMLVRDENGDIVTDNEGNPVINLTDEVFKLANQDPHIKTFLSQYPEDQRKNVLTGYLAPYANVDTQQRITSRRAPSSEGSGSVNQRFNNMVDEIIRSIQNAYRTPGGDYGSQLTKQAKALAPLLKGARYGAAIVHDVQFVSGKESGGNDRISLTLKDGTAGGEMVFRTEELDLTDEGSYSNLLSMLQSLKNKEDVLKVFEMNQQSKVDFADLIEEDQEPDQEPQKQDGLEMDNY